MARFTYSDDGPGLVSGPSILPNGMEADTFPSMNNEELSDDGHLKLIGQMESRLWLQVELRPANYTGSLCIHRRVGHMCELDVLQYRSINALLIILCGS